MSCYAVLYHLVVFFQVQEYFGAAFLQLEDVDSFTNYTIFSEIGGPIIDTQLFDHSNKVGHRFLLFCSSSNIVPWTIWEAPFQFPLSPFRLRLFNHRTAVGGGGVSAGRWALRKQPRLSHHHIAPHPVRHHRDSFLWCGTWNFSGFVRVWLCRGESSFVVCTVFTSLGRLAALALLFGGNICHLCCIGDSYHKSISPLCHSYTTGRVVASLEDGYMVQAGAHHWIKVPPRLLKIIF